MSFNYNTDLRIHSWNDYVSFKDEFTRITQDEDEFDNYSNTDILIRFMVEILTYEYKHFGARTWYNIIHWFKGVTLV